ncbi:DNA-binding MarR family transcriptional regulator [Solibacillus kalamii]|uniref:MarR family transcriptional regulator n=1 Tax=Solibacillus kalamii TaxID=1748298 RepID=A0ABX3ZER8_9BACL|nr:MarR family transcriptional regulator [Solibacillus kalamii]MBM7667069.1 DNA-binding MarR family transcriptional regulator [Solibacillus kalamii]OUZ38214.1 MarR family transcriptional regulator [Solibacillus kalamii]
MNPLFHIFFQQNRYLVNQLNDVLKQHGLFSSQWTVLFLLHQNGPMTLTAIWKYLDVEAPTVTRTVTRLETLGWVERVHGADKREKMIDLTTKAIEKFPQIEASVVSFEQKMTDNLSEEEQVLLIHLLKKMEG